MYQQNQHNNIPLVSQHSLKNVDEFDASVQLSQRHREGCIRIIYACAWNRELCPYFEIIEMIRFDFVWHHVSYSFACRQYTNNSAAYMQLKCWLWCTFSAHLTCSFYEYMHLIYYATYGHKQLWDLLIRAHTYSRHSGGHRI